MPAAGSCAVSRCLPDNRFSADESVWPLSSQLEMAPLPTAVACGRLHARNVLYEWKLSDTVQDAEILASELLTNSVKASYQQGTPVCLRLLAGPGQLLIEAWDQITDPPRPQQAAYGDESGRGLNVIEVIASRWGYYWAGEWKVVWAELHTHAHRT